MVLKYFSLVLPFIIIAGCNISLDKNPKRPPLVPINSHWIGGIDGGHWITCSKVKGNNYYCHIYLDSGYLYLYGDYCPLKPEEIKDNTLTIQGFDGLIIDLKEGGKLLPTGVIRFPHGGGHGKQQLYDCGISIGKEKEY